MPVKQNATDQDIEDNTGKTTHDSELNSELLKAI